MSKPPSTLDYRREQAAIGGPRHHRDVHLRHVLPLLAAGLVLWWAIAMRSHLAWSGNGEASGNMTGALISMARDLPSENLDLLPYTARDLGMGFHRVNHGGKSYLLIPRWVFVLIAVAIVVAMLIVVYRRRARVVTDTVAAARSVR